MDLIKKENGDFASGFFEGLGKSLGVALGLAIIALIVWIIRKIKLTRKAMLIRIF